MGAGHRGLAAGRLRSLAGLSALCWWLWESVSPADGKPRRRDSPAWGRRTGKSPEAEPTRPSCLHLWHRCGVGTQWCHFCMVCHLPGKCL